MPNRGRPAWPRRVIFERLSRDGEQTVRALTDHWGVSQPAASKHLGVLKLAGYYQVLVVEPNERLSYTWNASREEAAGGLRTVVIWTLAAEKRPLQALRDR